MNNVRLSFALVVEIFAARRREALQLNLKLKAEISLQKTR